MANREECLPSLDMTLLRPFLKAFVLLHKPSFVTLKGKRVKKNLEKVQMHRPLSGSAEAFVFDRLVLV